MKLQRRQFFKAGAGAALGLAVSKSAIANNCKTTTQTPTQPLGPFFPREQTPKIPVLEIQNPETPIYLANDSDLTWVKGLTGEASGQKSLILGRLTNKDCQPIPNATIIVWQASATGMYNHIGDSQNLDFWHPKRKELIKREHDPYFQYWGKAITDENGHYAFKTIVPGFYPANLGSRWYRPPHIHFMVSATGYPQHVTQMYFRGPKISENNFIQELNSKDLLLQNPGLNEEQKEALIVDFVENFENESPLLQGEFNIQISR